MKKISKKRRLRDVLIAYLHRSGKSRIHKKIKRSKKISHQISILNKWIWKKIEEGLNVEIKRNKVYLTLPSVMNFSEDYELTVSYLTVIRRLTNERFKSKLSYKLASIDFYNLVKISTSAALVLTSEISKWDDNSRSKLHFDLNKWNQEIAGQLHDLGYFELFKNNPFKNLEKNNNFHYETKIVRYIKGKCGDSNKARILKQEIIKIVGEEIDKWTFLHSGLTEAVINVSHHAYPETAGYSDQDKNWYLSGSFDEKKKLLKIVFYDQGIGIPKSLPASKVWEKALVILSRFPIIDRKKDEILLKAAVELDRTSTGKSDRGKGLQDLLEFIKQRDNGYLSIISSKGLYKYTMDKGVNHIKTVSFNNKLLGTLIIWSVHLD